jgi:endonuclease/exonuclease/phosphatase (EEP) superfamily protein YafD
LLNELREEYQEVRHLAATTRRLLAGAGIVYSIGIVALTVLWAIHPQRSWWVELSNIFAIYLFTPLALLAPLALMVRSRWFRLSVGTVGVIFLALFGGQFVPPLPKTDDGVRLRVVTYNQLYANRHVDDVIEAIRAQDADIVALQELSRSVTEGAERQLADVYPYQWMLPAESDRGQGILSRYPLQSLSRSDGFLGQEVVIDVGGQDVTLINVHLKAPGVDVWRARRPIPVPIIRDFDDAQRAEETAALLRDIDGINSPLIVLGDFNTGDREPAYAEFDRRLRDAYRETSWGLGYTFPTSARGGTASSPFPLVRIDYIWSAGGVEPVAARVDCHTGRSDHCMVIADVVVGTGS